MGLISGAITSVAGIFGYAYIVQASSTLGGLWQLLMGTAWCLWMPSGPPS